MQRYREKQTIQNFTAIFCCFALKVCVKGKLLPLLCVWRTLVRVQLIINNFGAETIINCGK